MEPINIVIIHIENIYAYFSTAGVEPDVDWPGPTNLVLLFIHHISNNSHSEHGRNDCSHGTQIPKIPGVAWKRIQLPSFVQRNYSFESHKLVSS